MIKKLMERLDAMTEPAYLTLKLTYLISIIILTAALFLFVLDRARYIDIVKELYSVPQALLLVGGLVSLVIEDISS